MGGEPKQFRSLDGRPVVCWAARALLRVLSGPIVVVVQEAAKSRAEGLLHIHLGADADRTRVVVGGTERSDSVRAGLAGIGGLDTVLVHDAARPFASSDLVEQVGGLAVEGRVVVPALRIDDTLKEIEGDRIVATRDRARFVRAQTPQGFPADVLRRAHAERGGVGAATDDAQLCEAIGIPVRWIDGESWNRKLTTGDDWEWAERQVEHGEVRWR